ncbi:MAG: winged helix-turn-helix domain-containing protein [Nitrosopumilaceae archaeon]|jgi:predicted transcriptional regulator
MSKTQYRSEMAIMHDILSYTANEGSSGVKISRLSRKANLSHYALIDKCQNLIEAGLVEMIHNERHRIYVLTEKGIKFYGELGRFLNLVQSFNLRC